MSEQFSPGSDAVVFASAQSEVALYELASRKVSRTWTIQGAVSAVTFSADGATVFAVNEAGALWSFDRASGNARQEGVPMNTTSHATAIVAAPDGRHLIYGDAQGRIGTFDFQAATVERQFAFAGHPAAALSADGANLFVATPGKNFLWNVAQGTPRAVWESSRGGQAEAARFVGASDLVAVMRKKESALFVEDRAHRIGQGTAGVRVSPRLPRSRSASSSSRTRSGRSFKPRSEKPTPRLPQATVTAKAARSSTGPAGRGRSAMS